jgi:ribosomal protein S6
MKFYELTYLLPPSLEEKEVEDIKNEVNALIEKNGGKIEKEAPPTKRVLAYPIEKESSAYLLSVDFYSQGSKITPLQEKIKKNSKILRHIIFKKSPLKKEIFAPLKKPVPPKKVELKEIDKKLEEIFKDEPK